MKFEKGDEVNIQQTLGGLFDGTHKITRVKNRIGDFPLWLKLWWKLRWRLGFVVLAALLMALPVWGQQRNPDGTVTILLPKGRATLSSDTTLPPCAFGLSRVEVYATVKPTPPVPSLDIAGTEITARTLELRIRPKRLACPLERAIALYGDERVRYTTGWPDTEMCPPGQICEVGRGIPVKGVGGKVEVCDDDGKTACVVVYTEPVKP